MSGVNRSSYDGYSCMNNPPCSYCTETSVCDKCGDVFDNSDLQFINDVYLCEDCLNDEMSPKGSK